MWRTIFWVFFNFFFFDGNIFPSFKKENKIPKEKKKEGKQINPNGVVCGHPFGMHALEHKALLWKSPPTYCSLFFKGSIFAHHYKV